MDKARSKKRQIKQQSVCNGGRGGDGNKAANLNSLKDTEMGRTQSLEEDDPIMPRCKSTKKFKSFVVRNAVDHSKVPRKLRSAMIKRSRESLSPPLSYAKKPDGMEGTPVNGTKKFKHNLKEEGKVLVSITKDEEEVARTLFSLARSLPIEKPVVDGVGCLSSAKKSSPLQAKESAQLASEGSKDESTLSQRTSSAAEHASVSDSVGGPSKQNLVAGFPLMGPPTGYGSTKFDLDLSSSGALVDLFRTSLPSMGVNREVMPLVDPSELGVSSEFCHPARSLPKHEVSHREQKLDYGLWPSPNAIKRDETQHPSSMQKGSAALVCIQDARPSTNKLPSWLVNSATTSDRPATAKTSALTEQVKPVVADKRHARKRCPTHVYISRLIHAHQASERTKLGVVSTNNPINNTSSSLGKSVNNNLLEKMPQQEQHMSILSSTKEKCDFLSLSAGGGLEPIHTTKGDNYPRGNNLAASSQGQIAYFPPSVRQYPPMAYNMSSPMYFPATTTQYRPGPRWQINGTHGSSSSLIPCGQPSFSGQQQQLFALTPSSFPRSYVGGSGGGLQQLDAITGLQC